jgi:hypothetical protein
MDWMLVGLGFAKCYIDDIIIFSLTLIYHMRKVFGKLKKHNLKLHPSKCWFFHTHVKYLGHMIYTSGLGVQKAKVEAISQVSRPIDVNRLWVFWACVINIERLWKVLVT